MLDLSTQVPIIGRHFTLYCNNKRGKGDGKDNQVYLLNFFVDRKIFETIQFTWLRFLGNDDATIPYKNSLQIMDMLKSENVELLYKKGSGHRFSDPDSLKLVEASLEKLMLEHLSQIT